jgi:hypothetical protein
MSAQYARAQYFPSGLTQRQAVIAGLDPAIHPFREEILQKKMDQSKSGLPDFDHS